MWAFWKYYVLCCIHQVSFYQWLPCQALNPWLWACFKEMSCSFFVCKVYVILGLYHALGLIFWIRRLSCLLSCHLPHSSCENERLPGPLWQSMICGQNMVLDWLKPHLRSTPIQSNNNQWECVIDQIYPICIPCQNLYNAHHMFSKWIKT